METRGILTGVKRISFGCLLLVLVESIFTVAVYAEIGQWTSTGPYGGDAEKVAFSPYFSTDHTIFALVDNDIFRSTDGAATWEQVTSLSFTFISIKVSPNFSSDHTVFAGTQSQGTGCLYRSTDGGTTWTACGPSGNFTKDIVFSKNYATDTTLYIGNSNGVWRSVDGGTNWTCLRPVSSVDSLAISPNFETDMTIFAGGYSAIYRSTDGGATWTTYTSGLGNCLRVRSLAVSPDYANDGTVYACTEAGGCLESDNNGANWGKCNGISSSSTYSVTFSPDYITDHTVYVGASGGVYKSVNSGSSWTSMNSGLIGKGVASVAVSPDFASDNTVLIGVQYNGVFKSTDGGSNWLSTNTGINLTKIPVVAVSPDYPSDSTVFAGSVLGYGLFKTDTGGASWGSIDNGLADTHVYSIAFSPAYATDQTVYAGTNSGLFKSTDGGADWTLINSNKITRVHSISLSPDYPADNTIYIGTANNGVIKSTDGGATWSYKNNGLTGGTVYSIAVSPDYSSDHTLFAGTFNNGIFKTSDGGENWTAANTGVWITNLYVYSIAFSPDFANDHTVFFAGDVSGDMLQGLYRSIDGGASWSMTYGGRDSMDISYEFNEVVVSSGFSSDHTVILNDGWQGVLCSTDGGVTWTNLNSSMRLACLAISPDFPNDKTLYGGGRFGAGVYRIDLSEMTPPVSSITYPADSSTIITSADIIITGTAVDNSGTGLQEVEVSTDDGTTWQTAAGTTDWSFTWPSPKVGISKIRSRAKDNNGLFETPGTGITVTVVSYGSPELQHYDWDASFKGGDCSACHFTRSTFVRAGFDMDPAFCLVCHNPSSVAHSKMLAGGGHSVFVNATANGARLPVYGNITSGEYDNRLYANFMDGDKVVCATCHNPMRKTEDMGRVFESATTVDRVTYSLPNGSWAGHGLYTPKVYRSTSRWTNPPYSPTYSKDKKKYIVEPSEYTFNEYSGTVTFNHAQGQLDKIYVTLDYPYLRASSENNRLCSDCHTQATHMNVNCLSCHTAHNTDNIEGVRGTVRATDRAELPVVFLGYSGAKTFADGDTTHDGICEVCHTQTLYHRRDGSGASHHDGEDCTSCHSHASGFAR